MSGHLFVTPAPVEIEEHEVKELKESGMSKRSAIMIDESKARAAIDSIKDRKRPSLVPAGVKARGKLRKKLGKELRPLFTSAGLDLAKLDKALQGNQADLRKSLAQNRAATAKQYAQAQKLRMAGLANTRAALEHRRARLCLTAYSWGSRSPLRWSEWS